MKKEIFDPTNFPFVIRALYLRNFATTMAEQFDPMIPGQVLLPEMRTEFLPPRYQEQVVADGSKGLVFTFITRYGFRYNGSLTHDVDPPKSDDSSESSAEMLAEITADVATSYAFSGTDIPAAEVLARWSQSSALIHSWPYWREFCHSAMARMNLPVTLMPMLDIQAALGSSAAQGDEPPDKIHPSAKKAPRRGTAKS